MPTEATHLAQLLSAHEVAQLLRVDAYTVRRYAREGYIPAYKVGKSYRFDRERVLAWLETRQLHPAAAAADVQPPEQLRVVP